MAEPQPIQGYMFEPEYDSDETLPSSSTDATSSDSEGEMHGDAWRLGSLDWCSCNACLHLPTAVECLCCKEMAILDDRLADLTCITQDPEFTMVCLNRAVLRTALIARADIRRDDIRNPISNKTFRYQAYRQFTYWVHQRLGKYVRRVIPSCAVVKIRELYPAPDGQYEGFKEAM